MRKRPAPWRALAALILSMALAGAVRAQAAYSPDLSIRQMFHDGERRAYGLYVPQSYRAGQPAPVIVALHGRYSSAKAFHGFSRLASVAERRGAVLIYPEPLDVSWGDGGHDALQRSGVDADDVGFITAALADVARTMPLDPERTFLVGYDTGGVMALRASCGGQTRFSGVAVVSALMWNFTRQACGAGAHSAPTLLIHGGRDANYPDEGAEALGERTAFRLGLGDTLATLRSVNGCSASSLTRGFVEACSGGALAFLPVPRGASEWYRDGAGYQLSHHGFDATQAIESFFFDRAGFSLPQVRERGVSRSWITYVPASYDPAKPTPLVVLLHGRPSSATEMAVITRMHEVADRHGFIVTYPEGLNNEWNAFYDLTGQRSIAPQDDVAFLKTLTEDLGQDFNIDRSRMYIGGFSNGGFMTIRMACSASDVFAGFAVVSAELYTVLKDVCRRSRPSPILLMHGTEDPSVPYNGVIIRGGPENTETRVSLGARDTLAWFVERNHCSQAGTMTTFPIKGQSPGTQAQRFMPHDCQAPVSFYLINGGGHTWPGTVPLNGLGPLNMDINAGEEIWQFFEPLSLKPGSDR
jgi:polyhydroxybutyrate depolymerase